MDEPTGNTRPLTILVVVALAFLVTFLPLGLSPEAHKTLAILVLVGGLWATEALPIPVTALLVPVLGTLAGVMEAKPAFAGFGDPIVFLFMGAFLLADAAEQHGLNARLARTVLGSSWVSTHPSRMIWAIAFLGVVISAWANNTATTALILPLALSAERLGNRRLLVGVLLMAAYAPTLGGFATPVGTAPNLIGLRLLEQASGQRPSFAAWVAICAPLSVVMAVLTSLWLIWRARGRRGEAAAAPAAALPAPAESTTERRPWSLAERTLLPVYALVILFWCVPGIVEATAWRDAPWFKLWRTRLPEAVVPLFGAFFLFVLPSGVGKARILDVSAIRRIDWGTLLLFGGGLSLGAMMFESGLAKAIGEAIFRVVPVSSEFGIVLAATLMAIVVSEVTSNTASASLVVPVVLALAQVAGADPVKPALAATVGCSFGFMLPVSTPPNALVYGTGKLRIREMISHGAVLDVVGALLIATWFTLFG